MRRRPDVPFVSAERWPLDRPLSETGDWEVSPDLAIEVVSPNDRFKDVLAKVHEYCRDGARRVWLVVPEESQVLVYSERLQIRILSESDELADEELSPGFRVSVSELFQRR